MDKNILRFSKVIISREPAPPEPEPEPETEVMEVNNECKENLKEEPGEAEKKPTETEEKNQ